MITTGYVFTVTHDGKTLYTANVPAPLEQALASARAMVLALGFTAPTLVTFLAVKQ